MLKLQFIFIQIILAKQRLLENAGLVILEENGKFPTQNW